MKRYIPTFSVVKAASEPDAPVPGFSMEEDSKGYWTPHRDAVSVIAQKDALLAEMAEELESARKLICARIGRGLHTRAIEMMLTKYEAQK